MRLLPIVFGFFLARFPSALFVYWITSNCITFAQNYVIYYVLPHKKAEPQEETPSEEATNKSAPPVKEEQEKGEVPQEQKSGRAKNRKKKKVGRKK